MRNAADETQVKQAGDRDKRRRETELADIAAVLKMTEGQRFFKRLFDYCGVTDSAFRSNDRQEAYVVGAQDVGHYFIKDMLEASPAIGTALLAEAFKEKKVSN